MNKHYRPLSMILCILLLTSAYAHAGGGGMSSGGTAIRCAGKALRMSDTFFADIQDSCSSEDRASFIGSILKRLTKLNSEFAESLRIEWERVGPSELWEEGSEFILHSGDAYLPLDLSQVLGDCHVVQVASFQPGAWMPKKARENYSALSIAQRRVLELHETLFILGVRNYGHINPILTRDLVESLLDQTPSYLDSNLHVNLKRFTAEKKIYNADAASRARQVFRLMDSSERGICPLSLELESWGSSEVYVILNQNLGMTYSDGVGIFFRPNQLNSRFGQTAQSETTSAGMRLTYSSSEYGFELLLPFVPYKHGLSLRYYKGLESFNCPYSAY